MPKSQTYLMLNDNVTAKPWIQGDSVVVTPIHCFWDAVNNWDFTNIAFFDIIFDDFGLLASTVYYGGDGLWDPGFYSCVYGSLNTSNNSNFFILFHSET